MMIHQSIPGSLISFITTPPSITRPSASHLCSPLSVFQSLRFFQPVSHLFTSLHLSPHLSQPFKPSSLFLDWVEQPLLYELI